MQVMLSKYIDKVDGFDSLSYTEQVKYLGYFFVKSYNDPIFTPKNIKDFFDLAHLPQPKNVADICSNLAGKKVFLPTKYGYKFHRSVFQQLEDEFSTEKPKKKISKKLRDLIPKISKDVNRNFLSEAIDCYEINAYRSAIVMTWLLVIDNIYEYILTNKLNDFNSAIATQNLKIKKVSIKEDFNELKESKFIEICRSANVISNDLRKILDEKLGIRNTCAHPNNIVISESKATSFIEDLIENVMLRFFPKQ